MADSINILILSCGTRNKIVQYFKKELGKNGKVFATDLSELAPALYDADKYFIVPKVNDINYLDTILEICKKYEIDGVLSLIDPELSILARNRDKFIEIGTLPIVSNLDVVERSFNKYKFNEFLKSNSFNYIKSYLAKESFYQDLNNNKIEFPVFVKPVEGSASLNINLVHSKGEIEMLFSRHDNLIIQEFMDGTEYGIDVYVDLISGEIISIFIKEKIKMRAGETDKSKSIHNKELKDLIEEFVRMSKYRGIIDIDVFEVDGNYYISEVNPRFGGGYPHAYGSGVNVPKMIVNNINGKKNFCGIGKYPADTLMMKYNDLIVT